MNHDPPRPAIVRIVQGRVCRMLGAKFGAGIVQIGAHESGPNEGQFEIVSIADPARALILTALELREFARELIDASNGEIEIAVKGER